MNVRVPGRACFYVKLQAVVCIFLCKAASRESARRYAKARHSCMPCSEEQGKELVCKILFVLCIISVVSCVYISKSICLDTVSSYDDVNAF